MSTQTDALDSQRMVLRETLRRAVPMWMRELRKWPFEYLLIAAAHDTETIAAHGGKPGPDTFHALARGLAIHALLADGGVDYQGLHWCADPHCQAAARHGRAIHTLPDLATWPPPD